MQGDDGSSHRFFFNGELHGCRASLSVPAGFHEGAMVFRIVLCDGSLRFSGSGLGIWESSFFGAV